MLLGLLFVCESLIQSQLLSPDPGNPNHPLNTDLSDMNLQWILWHKGNVLLDNVHGHCSQRPHIRRASGYTLYPSILADIHIHHWRNHHDLHTEEDKILKRIFDTSNSVWWWNGALFPEIFMPSPEAMMVFDWETKKYKTTTIGKKKKIRWNWN